MCMSVFATDRIEEEELSDSNVEDNLTLYVPLYVPYLHRYIIILFSPLLELLQDKKSSNWVTETWTPTKLRQ